MWIVQHLVHNTLLYSKGMYVVSRHSLFSSVIFVKALQRMAKYTG